ncbi:MAG TPA: hypothetical protein VMF64_17150 [Steroidobacteraceae bacterium]|nr:hypothetical protein [Steroidobacteraceae bacterium]
MNKTLIATAALIGALNLSGCMLVMGSSGYHGDHGDLVSSDGSVRYIGWCDVHPHNSRCLDTGEGKAVALHPGAVALAPSETSPPIADIN